MSNPTTIPSGNVKGEWALAVTLSPAAVANATSAEQTFTVTGLLLGDHITVNKPTAQAGIGIVGSRCSANDVLAITFMNATAATVTPTASEVYLVKISRVDNLTSSNVPLLTQLVS